MEANAETPATSEAPSAAPAADLSLDDIIAQATTAAESAGTPVIADEEVKDPAGAEPAEAAPATDGEPAAEPATSEEPKADEITTARARKILQAAEELQAKFDARDRELTQREQAGMRGMVEELLKAPKAFLAKHGRHIDDVIDASVAEGKPEAPAAEDDNPRLTALEKRLEAKEREEQATKNQAAIDNRVREIHAELKGSPKFPLINEAGRASDVTDYMVEYHRVHGKPITWDRAAFLIEQDLKRTGEKVAAKLGWKPAEAAKPAAPPVARPGTQSIGGAQTASATEAADAEPTDPDDLLKFLVAKAQGGQRKTA